jgi:hypothetical protein
MEYIYLFTYFIYCMDDEANNDEGENVEWHLYAVQNMCGGKICGRCRSRDLRGHSLSLHMFVVNLT